MSELYSQQEKQVTSATSSDSSTSGRSRYSGSGSGGVAVTVCCAGIATGRSKLGPRQLPCTGACNQGVKGGHNHLRAQPLKQDQTKGKQKRQGRNGQKAGQKRQEGTQSSAKTLLSARAPRAALAHDAWGKQA